MRYFTVSVMLHLLLVLLLGSVVLFQMQPEVTDFTGESGSGFVGGGEEGAGRPQENTDPLQSEQVAFDPTAQVQPSESLQAITSSSTAPSSFSMAAGSGFTPSFATPRLSGARSGLAGNLGGAGRFGAGSGLGKGLGKWIGSEGLGISGRGKNLKTLNEFYCYFVIHSGDWYAALDWRGAPESRQKERSAPGHPDLKNISFYKTEPIDDVGPFISYYYGFFEHPNREGQILDDRGGCVEFTPGAMSNLLKFIRVASNNNIKGGGKPKAVVLDPELAPYRYDKASRQITWNPEARDKLREKLRASLPGGNKFSVHGYLWNPEPEEKESTDFLVEYLLDIEPFPPFIYFTGNDDFVLTDIEVDTLYKYVLKGGAIWGDCGFAGHRSKFDVAFRREMKRVIPDADKPFRVLPNNNNLFLKGEDAFFDLAELPPGMHFYTSPIEVIELMPGIVSVVLTKNAYGNFLRYEMTRVNNAFTIGGEVGRGKWVNRMWEFRGEFFRGLGDENILQAYCLGTNITVYMLGRWPTVLNRLGNVR